jgi:hypothetical protein
LIDKWLHESLFVIERFTKSEFAKGIVSPRQRIGLALRKDMFKAMKHGLWDGQR